MANYFLLRNHQLRNIPIFFLYDNFKQARKVRHQRKDHQASFVSGTTGTIVVGEDVGEELPSTEEVPDAVVTDIRLTKDDAKHFKVVYRHHLSKALKPELNKGPLFKALAIPPVKVLTSRPTEAYELAAMEIDQSSVSGNLAVLEEMRKVLDLDKELFKELKMILAGDHLSVSRLRTLMSRKSDDTTFFDRLSWAIPVLQLFRMQMLLCTSILRTHFGGNGLRPGSLRYYKVKLDRKGLDDEKPSHHHADEFLRTVFTAMVRRMWQSKKEGNTQDSGATPNNIFLSEISKLVDRNLLSSDDLFDHYSTTNANAILFIRDMVVYLEFCAAIKEGDVGRIEEILKRITIILQSGKHSNYALELLRLRFNIQHRWSENRKNAIFSSLLMNTKGLPHRWIPSDMKMRMEYKLTEQSTYHRDVSSEGDITIVMNSLVEDNILGLEKCPVSHRGVERVVDAMALGWERLSHGGYVNFLKRMLEDEVDLKTDGGSDYESNSGSDGSSDAT
ncbi:hypothetical protein F5H01DRAFT_405679 [Linnemannia elongata]|nr:hypothetical protein F5H01DRAFT_405679 [Linnemannia elongata]